MPFGKHKGEAVEDLPTGYIQWVCENIKGNDALIQELENQLTMRRGESVNRGKAK